MKKYFLVFTFFAGVFLFVLPSSSEAKGFNLFKPWTYFRILHLHHHH